MAVEEVGARLTLKDRPAFSRGLRESERDVESLGRAADRAGRKFGDLGTLARGARSGITTIGSLAAGAAVGVAALAAGGAAAGMSLVNLASDAAETESKFRTVFGPQGMESVTTWITGIQENVHIATDELRDAASTFGVFGQAVGVPAQELAGFSTDLAQAGLDLASFHNAVPEDVFLALRSGLAGEAEPLRQFGIFLSDTSLNAFAAAEGIGRTTQEMTEQEKVLLRQRFILAGLGAAEGDLMRTSEGFANQQRGLLGAFKDLRVEMGEALLPAAQELIPLLTSGVRNALSGISDRMPDLQRRFRDWGRDAVDWAGRAASKVGEIWTNFRELGFQQGAIQTVADMFGPGAATVLERVFDAAEDVGVLFRDTLVPAFQGAQEALGPLAGVTLTALADGLGWAADHAADLAPWVEKIFVLWITNATVQTIMRAATAIRGLGIAMGFASAASAGGAGAAAGGAAAGGLMGRFLTGIGLAGAGAGLLAGGTAAALGGVVWAAQEQGSQPTALSSAGINEPMPMPGEAPPGSRRANPVSIPRPVATGHDSWGRSATVTVAPTYNVNGTNMTVDQFERMLRNNSRTLAEEVQRALQISGSRS